MSRCLACGGTQLEPWATAEDIEYRSLPERFAFLRCTACDSLSIDPVPRDRLQVIYPPSYYSFAATEESLPQRVKQWLDRRAFRRLAQEIPGERLRALDVGGGTGYMLDLLQAADPRFAEGVVVDIDPQAEARAKAAGHGFFLGEIERYPEGEAFDLILMINLIEHVADPAAVLQKAGRLLAPGGRILVKTPNHDSFDARLFRHASWGGYHCPRHWVLFTMPSFQALAARCGLATVWGRYTQGAPFWSVSTIDWLQRKGLLKRRGEPLYRHPLNGPLMGLFAAFDFLRMPFAKTSQMILLLRKN